MMHWLERHRARITMTGVEEAALAAEIGASAAEAGGFAAFDAATAGGLAGVASSAEAGALASLSSAELGALAGGGMDVGNVYGAYAFGDAGWGGGGEFIPSSGGYGTSIAPDLSSNLPLTDFGFENAAGQLSNLLGDAGFTGAGGIHYAYDPELQQFTNDYRYLTTDELAAQPGVGAGEPGAEFGSADPGSGFPYGQLREVTQGVTETPGGLNIPQQFGSVPVSNALKEGGVPDKLAGPLAGAGIGAAGSLSSTDFGGDFGGGDFGGDLGGGELGDLATGDELTGVDAGAQAVEGAATSAGDALVNTNLPSVTGGELASGIEQLGGADSGPDIEAKPIFAGGADFGGLSFDGGIASSPSEVTPFGGFGGGGGDAGLLGDAGGDMLRGYETEASDNTDWSKGWQEDAFGSPVLMPDGPKPDAPAGAAGTAGAKAGFFDRMINDPGTVGQGMLDNVGNWVEKNPIQAALAAMTVYGATKNGALTGAGQPSTISQVPGGKEVTAASTRAAQVADAELQRFQTGQLNPGQQQQLDQWKQDRLNETNNYYAKAGLSGSTMHIQASQFINGQYEQLKQKMIDSALTNGLASLGAASKEVATAANFQLGQDQAFQSALSNATKAVGYLAGNAPRLAA